MIQTLQITPEILTSNTDNINFDITDLRGRNANCCGWLQYNQGQSDFTILGGGLFEISFNANVTSDTAGIVALALKGISDIEGTEMDAEITTPGNYVNISFTKLLRICPRINQVIAVGSLPATTTGTTTLVNTPTEIPVVKDANFIIRKVA